MKERSEKNWKPFKKEEVWLEMKNLKLPYKTTKIAPRRVGPFKVTAEVGPHAYCLKLPEQWRIHNIFHTSLLSPYVETETHRKAFLQPPPEVIEGEEEHEIEVIVSHR